MGTLVLQLEVNTSAPSAARRWVGSSGMVPAGRRPDVLLLVSEVVANAVAHGPRDGLIELRLSESGPALRIEVHNAGGSPPAPFDPRPGGGGMGLRIIEMISDRWGVVPGPPTVVWFEVGPG